jgi:diguanylate cyclase (GGDEF)-like protein/PAS domain S-box-containing protein
MEPTKLLIVEDERIIAMDIRQRLLHLGYDVVGMAANGSTALERVLALGPDVVLMDINLEGKMDGTEAARLIHEQHGTPVIFLTAYATDDALNRALGSHPFGYLLKPVETRELHAALQTALTRHSAEQAVARSEQRLQLALDAAGMGVWEWEPGTGRFTTGGLFNSVLGEPPNPVDESMERFLARLHPDDRGNARQSLEQTLGQDARVNNYFRYLDTDSRIGWLEVHARVNRSPHGEWLTGVIKDVTERRHMEEELRRSAAVFETISEGLFTLSNDGLLISANPAFERLTGYHTTEIMGCDPEDFLHARRHSDRFYQRLANVEEGHWQGETRCQRKNGEIFPVWESVRAVFDSEGRVSHYVAAITDITQLRRAEEKVNHLAYHDPLTGLPNRMLLNDRLDQTLKLAERKNTLCAVMFIDLDGFKSINDTLGHSCGDLLLQTVAARIQGKLRDSDTVARMGGDEFVVIVDDLDRPEVSSRVAGNLLEALSLPMDLGGEPVAVSGSIGIAVYPTDGQNRQALMQAADTAMYNAKAQGKNRICFYTPDLAVRASERMSLEQGLRQAIKSEAFILHYQPQYRLKDGVLMGVEALIRWPHPEKGLIPPGLFIPLAEEAGLIEAIGAWVLRQACSQVGAWLANGGAPLRLSVNVSARQIMHGEIIAILSQTLLETGFPAHLLEIEITESTLQSVEDSRIFLGELRAMGVGVAIDDFGTGYSSLSVLKHLHIDRLKIDQSFIHDIPQNEYDVGIVEAIVAMARKLRLTLVAEGVENEAQLELLRRLNCDEVQGNLLGHPAPWQDLATCQP